MQFAAILAGGSGVRMGNPNKPKQFFYLGDKPILVHTLEKFCAAGCFDGILVLTPATWVQQTKDIIAKHCPQYADAVNVIAGGAERNDTIMNAIRYFEDECQADGASIIVTHDAVRPFVSLRIIEDNIAAARSWRLRHRGARHRHHCREPRRRTHLLHPESQRALPRPDAPELQYA